MPEPEWRAMSDKAHATAVGYTWDDAADQFEVGAYESGRLIGIRMIPNFVLIIGAMKSGTTTLYDYLAQHPQIAPAAREGTGIFRL